MAQPAIEWWLPEPPLGFHWKFHGGKPSQPWMWSNEILDFGFSQERQPLGVEWLAVATAGAAWAVLALDEDPDEQAENQQYLDDFLDEEEDEE